MFDLQHLAAQLNAACACKLLDEAALRRNLQADSVLADWLVNAQDSHAHLFSSTGVFISPKEMAALTQAVDTLHTVMSRPSWAAAVLPKTSAVAQHDWRTSGVFMGYDFHMTEAGPKLIEVNTNAGGAMLNLALARAQGGQSADCRWTQGDLQTATPLENLEAQWLDMFVSEYEVQTQQPLPTEGLRIAIVDEAPTKQYLYPEFLLFQNLFKHAGWQAWVCDPQDLVWTGTALQYVGQQVGQRIDVVYLRLTDFYFNAPQHAHLKAAYESGACVFSPSPRAHALYANKQHLVELSSPQAWSDLRLSAVQQSVLRQVVPHTVRLSADNAAQLWLDRANYFFKPLTGYGSKATYRGDKLTKKTWEHLLQNDYVAQALIPPSQRVVSVNDGLKNLKLDIRAYAWQGHIQLLAARLYAGQTTNFRTDGGGFAPVFVA